MPTLRNEVSLTELDDAALDAAISDMEGLIATRPDFTKFVATSLEEHKSERAARARVDTESGNATPAYGEFLLDSPLLTAVEKSTGRSTRIRICPVRYGLGAEDAVSDGPILSLAEQIQLDINKTMRLQLKANDEILKEAARDMACPLLCAELGLPFPPVTNDLGTLMKTQIRKPALAADGHQYELRALQKYIQKNMDGVLVSPITKKQMPGCINYVVKSHGVKDSSRVKWKHKTWQPALSSVLEPAR